ncbi:MAG: CpaF family protein [Acidimicrobiales bacterium]|nr:CpaF family protein [Acidimicrobiales bacterium]
MGEEVPVLEPEVGNEDPTHLPALFTEAPPPLTAGRARGSFTLRPAAAVITGETPEGAPALGRHEVSGAPTRDRVNGYSHASAGPPPAGGVRPGAGLDWGLVSALRTVVADRLAHAAGGGWGAGAGEEGRSWSDRAAQEHIGWQIIEDLIAEHAAEALKSGEQGWSSQERAGIGQALFDAVFRLGRLQPLVDDDRVENIFILGYDTVLLELVDGSRTTGAAVADSDEELIDFLRFLANRSESNPRPFSESYPRLHMKLDGGARLAATAWVVSRPTVVIRRHRLTVDSLQGWVDRGCMSEACANFLAAAVRASWSIAVSGPMSAGKTTLMRALCAQIPAEEAIGTFETEHELFLKDAGDRDIVIDWEARPGVGEIGADGRAAGAFDLTDALTDSFRFALSRQIVGEIRGPEVWTMIKAMESGTGSLSTTHAANAETCIRKLVTCAMEAGKHVSKDTALEKIVLVLDVIVQLRRQVVTLPDGSQRLQRWVSEVVIVEPGEREKGYALTHVFGPATTGPATATGILPTACAALEEFGFDPAMYQVEADTHPTRNGGRR